MRIFDHHVATPSPSTVARLLDLAALATSVWLGAALLFWSGWSASFWARPEHVVLFLVGIVTLRSLVAPIAIPEVEPRIIVAVGVALTPLAYASPPDPTWVDGFFDDDDGDDVVIAISWAAWAVDLDPLAVATPLFASVSFLPVGEPELASIAPRSVFLGRAPRVA